MRVIFARALLMSMTALLVVSFQNCGGGGGGGVEAVAAQELPMDLTINTSPSQVTADAHAVFQFASQNQNVTFKCALDSAPFTACASPLDFPSLADGDHTIKIQVLDGFGVVWADKEYSFTIDATAPTVSVTKSPGAWSTADGTVEFNGTDAGPGVLKFECSLDNAAYAACTSPYAYTGLAAGAHKIQIRGVDGVGHETYPAAINFQVDDVMPQVNLVALPSGSTQVVCSEPYFHSLIFNPPTDGGGSGIASLSCSLNDGPEEGCGMYINGTPQYWIYQKDVNWGLLTIHIHVRDNAGNHLDRIWQLNLIYNSEFCGGG